MKLIVTDLDNTLLRTDKTISRYTMSVLEKCRAAGCIIAFATARSKQAAQQFIEMFTPDVFIGFGGALALAGGKVIKRFDIPAETSHKLINECLLQPCITAVYAVNEYAALTNRPSPLGDGWSHYKSIDFTAENKKSYLKISVDATRPDVVERIAENYPMCGMLRYSGEDLYSFSHIDAEKWQAVKCIAEHHNIDKKDIFAFGDDINDLEMLRNSGTGVAVANAVDSVKRAAKHICRTNDEDGVARWLVENILI